jgi:predicted nucleotidyltransferase
METTKNKLTPYQTSFFNRLSTYLDTKLYFFGSIQRQDYFPESSDIDVDIFTDNESATIVQMMNFLHVEDFLMKIF